MRWPFFVGGIVALFLSSGAYWAMTPAGGLGGRAAPILSESNSSFTVVIAGRDIEYCKPGYGPGNLPAEPCKGAERYGKRTDTIIFAKVQPGRVDLISIPRDTRSGEGWTYLDKINFAFDNGGQAALTDAGLKITDAGALEVYQKAGAEGLKRSIEGLLGVSVDYHVIFNVEVVSKVIDALGGVDVYLPEAMQYTDVAAQLFIDLPAGNNHLDGQKALGYLRFRHGVGSDYARMDRSKEVLGQLLNKLRSPSVIAAIPALVGSVAGGLVTNLEPGQIVGLLPQLKNLKANFATLPTVEQNPRLGSFLFPDGDKIAALMSPITGAETLEPERAPTTSLVVLDRSGTPDLGTRISRYLQRRGWPKPTVLPLSAADVPTQILRRDWISKTEAEAYSTILSAPVATPWRFPDEAGNLTLELGRDAAKQYAAILEEVR